MTLFQRMVAAAVIGMVARFLREKYRVVTPPDLEKVVQDYLDELLKLGYEIRLKELPKGGEADEINATPGSDKQNASVPHVTQTRKRSDARRANARREVRGAEGQV